MVSRWLIISDIFKYIKNYQVSNNGEIYYENVTRQVTRTRTVRKQVPIRRTRPIKKMVKVTKYRTEKQMRKKTVTEYKYVDIDTFGITGRTYHGVDPRYGTGTYGSYSTPNWGWTKEQIYKPVEKEIEISEDVQVPYEVDEERDDVECYTEYEWRNVNEVYYEDVVDRVAKNKLPEKPLYCNCTEKANTISKRCECENYRRLC